MARSVEEIKKRMAKTKFVEEDEQSEVRPGYERLDDLKRRVNRDAYHKTQSERINSILQGAQSYFSGFQDKLDGMTWENASQVNDQITADSSRMLEEYNEVRNYLDTHGDRLDNDTYTALEESLKAMESARVQAQSFAADRKSYFASFDSEEAYIRGALENSEQRQQRYADNQERIKQLQAQRALAAPGATYNPDSGMLLPVFDPAWSKVKEIDEEINALEAENLKYKRGEDGFIRKTVDDHRKTTQNADFEAVSANRDYANPSKEEIELADAMNDSSTWKWDDANGVYRDSFGNELAVDETGTYYNPVAQQTKVADKLALYLNTSEDDRVAAAMNTGGMREGIWTSVMREGYDSAWEYLTEDEVGIYYYYLSESQERAYQYLSDMQVELNRRRTLDEMGQWQGQYDESGFWGKAGMNLLSVPAQLASGFTGMLDNVANMLMGNDINPYSTSHSGMHYSQTVRGATAADLDETGLKIPGVDFTLGDLYQSGMSMVDSLAAMGVGGTYGGVLLAGGAAENEAYRLYQQGASTEQIAFGAAAAGATEMIFESISIGELDKIKNMKSPETLGQFFKTLLVQGGVEASEEALTEVANTVANAFIMGSESDWAALIEEKDGNLAAALMDKTLDVLHSGLGGFFSGAGSGSIVGGTQYAINKLATNAQYRNVGGAVIGTEGGVELLTVLAKKLDGISAYKLGKQAEAVSKKATAKNVGRLFTDINRTVNEQNSKDLSARLVEAGFDAKAAAQIADAVIALRSDPTSLTTEQTSLLEEVQADERALTAIEEVLDTEGSAAYQRSEQLNAILTEIATTKDNMAAEATGAADGEVTLESLARETVDARYDAEDGAGLDGISAEGRAIYGNEAVDVVDIDKAGGGKVTVKLADGRSVDATALEYEDSGEAELWRVIGKYAENADSARALLEEYRKGDLDAYKYARGVEEGFLYGKLNMSPKEMELQGSYVNLLDPAQRNMAYSLGEIAGKRKAQQTKQQQENVDAVYEQAKSVLKQKDSDVGEHGVQLADGLTVEKMGKTQRPSYELAKQIAPAVKADIRIYNGGKEWGYYDHETDTICLNINAKWSGVSMMTFTLAHELVHRAKRGSLAKYEAFADFLIQQYGKQGASVNAMVQEQLQAAEENGISMSYEEAFEEVICDACQKMLVDTDAGKRLAEFGAKSEQNKSIVKRFAQQLKELIQKLRRIFRNVEPDSLAAQEFQRFDNNVKQILADMFVDMSMDAGEKLSTIKAAGLTEKITTGEGGVKYKLSSTAKAEVQKALADKKYGLEVKLTDSSPSILLAQKGVRNLPMLMNASHIRENIFTEEEAKQKGLRTGPNINYHGLGEKLFLDVIDGLDDVTEAYRGTKNADDPSRREKYFLLVSKYVDQNGDTINVPVYINEKGAYNRVFIDTNKVATVYGKIEFRKYIQTQISKSNLVRIKNRSNQTSESTSPINADYGKGASKGSIRNSDPNVNKNSEGTKKGPFKLPVSKDAADRGMLVDLFEQMVTGSDEYRALQNYKKNIEHMLALEEKVDRLTEEIKRVSFAEGPRDMEYLNNLKQQRKKAVAELNRYDNILLGLEKSGVLRSMIERNRKVIQQEARDKTREYYRQKNEAREAEIRQYYRESRRKAVERHEQAEVRQRIRKDVQRLDSLLNKGTKEKNVKLELREFAGAALRTAKGTFLKNYNEYDMVRNGVGELQGREQKAVFARAQELLKELDMLRIKLDPESIHEKWDPEEQLRLEDREEALKKELAKNMAVLRSAGVFKAENERIEDANADQLMDELMAAYVALENSDQAHIKGVFSQEIYDHMESVKKFLAGKAIKDMTAIELGELHKMYRMVLHTITTSNDLFVQKRKADVRTKGEKIIAQLRTKVMKEMPLLLKKVAAFGWSNLSLDTALELIGSDELIEVAQPLYEAQNTYQTDLDHAKAYLTEQVMKYGRKNWDVSKTMTFASTEITLGQAMSLYAYTRRQQAQEHLEGEGFTHSENVRFKKKKKNIPVELTYIKNAALTYKVTKEQYAAVEKLLTKEQRDYVDALVEYLSKVMGAKGNEVSVQLHGVKLFEETYYIPINTANEFFEDPLGAKKGEKKIRNKGFTEKTKDGAKNPIVLDNFENVFAKHIEEMSMYHAYVLPMEDFTRVYNYHHAVEENVTDEAGEVYATRLKDTEETVKVDINKRCGSAATEYIAKYMQNLNGGVRGDATEELIGGVLSNFKKTAVLGSGSVILQQPAAFIRAMPNLNWEDCFDWKSRLGKDAKPAEGLKKEMYKWSPVARMKLVGGFDPAVGRTSRQYLFGEYKDGERLVKRGVEWVNDKLGKAPEKMDEITWSYIWLCTKRQIHRQHPELKINSEEFLQKTAERFEYIIRDSQVYDSIMVKPLIMQSKNLFVKSITAFKNEPLKGLNQSVRAWLQWKHGKISGKQCARVFAATYGANLLAGALGAFSYAARDDDEDETYWEKYVSAVVSKAMEGAIPLYSIPYVADIMSAFEGYGVDRADMSLFVDAIEALPIIFSTEEDAWVKLEKGYGRLLNALGIPVENLVRETRAICRIAKTIWGDFKGTNVKGTAAGMKYAVIEGLPIVKEVKKKTQWQNAMLNGDTAHLIRLAGTYENEESANNAARSAVKDLFTSGDITSEQAAEFLQAYVDDTAADAQEKITRWRAEKETGIAYDDIKDKFIADEISEGQAKEMYMTYGGYDDQEALKKVTQWRAEKETGIAYDDIKDKFIAGEITEQQAKEMYITYGGYDEDDAQKKVTYWAFLKEHPESELEQSPALKFLEFAEPAGISLDIYTQYVEVTADIESDKDKNGETITNSKREKVWVEIHKLPLSKKQKDALHYAAGYKESKLDEAPWH